MQKIVFTILLLFWHFGISAQARLYCKEARISFFSKTAMENIVAQNNKALCVWDTATDKYEFSVLIKGFEFDRALMQEHFNENYMESDKYPKAAFKGVLRPENSISLRGNGSYKVTAVGILTIHGVSKPVSLPATILVNNGMISSRANFTVLLSDYKIVVPAIVSDKINRQISISVFVPSYKSS